MSIKILRTTLSIRPEKLNKFCGIMFKIRDRCPVKCLLAFYHSFARVSYNKNVVVNYGSTSKGTLNSIEKAQRTIFRAILLGKKWELLQYYCTENKLPIVDEMFGTEAVWKFFKQLRNQAPVKYVDLQATNQNYNTRRKAKDFLPSTFKRVLMKKQARKMFYVTFTTGWNILNWCHKKLKVLRVI